LQSDGSFKNGKPIQERQAINDFPAARRLLSKATNRGALDSGLTLPPMTSNRL